jgi:hypothetical protein
MRFSKFKSVLIKTGLAASVLLAASGAVFAQQQINLTAALSVATMPDGSTVPMWGYSCGTAVTGSTATCAASNPGAGSGWSPVVITVPVGTGGGVGAAAATTGGVTINLTNNLSFTPTGATTPNAIPTSLVIVGQVGGGLGSSRTTTPSPVHAGQSVTWPTANTGPTNVPPPQGPRVQSLATEVAAGATTALTWSNLKPGTYLIESGTHASIQGPMGLYGILVVTEAPTATTTTPIAESAPGCAYGFVAATTTTAATCAVPYDAEVPMLLSEIDPVQNNAVNTAVNTAGFSETTVWSGQPGGCGNPASPVGVVNTCYPPAVNYTPLYYMVNGVAFTRTSASSSLFPVSPATIAPATGTTGNVLVRIVNAGLRMHVPSIVGSQVAGATGATNPIVTGFKVMAEDGNLLPGVPKIRSEIFMAAGKVYDVMINGQSTSGTTITPYTSALALFDRELSLSGNATERDAGMLGYIGINGAGVPAAAGLGAAVARADTYNALVTGVTLNVSDPSRGLIANDTNVYGVTLLVPPANGTVTLANNGTFTYVPTATATSDSFTYCANGTVTGTTCSSGITATVTLAASNIVDTAGVTCTAATFSSTMATYLGVKTPGVLAGCKDGANLPLTVVPSSVAVPTGSTLSVVADANGGFTATAPAAGAYSFTFQAQNSQKTLSAVTTVNLVFPPGSGLSVSVVDGAACPQGTPLASCTTIGDYRWVIEEDRTFYVNPNCTANPPPSGCPTSTGTSVEPTYGVNFHTSYMPFVAQGCTGPLSCELGQTLLGSPAVCDVGNGVCRTTGSEQTAVLPGQVALDPTKRYYISILPGDAANPFGVGYLGAPDCSAAGTAAGHCGHGMGGAPIAAGQTSVTVLSQAGPYQPGRLAVMVFEDDFPLNGEQDAGGGIDVLAPNEPGLGGFNIQLWDPMAANGDFTGQMTYDMFNQPLTNSLDGTIDPVTGLDACPVTLQGLVKPVAGGGITGMIVTCPKYEGDGSKPVLSPLAGQAVINNLMQARMEVIATPGADRIARGEEWLQTNTLDGEKAHDVFIKIGEPAYFQEFGPAGYHATIGFANPAIINARRPGVCAGTDSNLTIPGGQCAYTLKGKVTTERMSRVPDERLYSSGSYDSFHWTQCYVSFGDTDGEDFAFTKCDGQGNFTLSGLPPGTWRVTVFDQWNDILVDGLSTPVALGGSNTTVDMGEIASNQWQINLYTRTFIDDNKDGVSQSTEGGIPLVPVTVRYRDGSLGNTLNTDFTGTANFNETFPLFNWYVVETDVTRYKNTGTHVVYDSGGPADGTSACGQAGYPPCGTSVIGNYMANTAETVSLPTSLRVPGAVYCAGADCTGKSILNGPASSDPPSVCTTSVNGPAGFTSTCSPLLSTGRIDPPWLGGVEGWQGYSGQNNFVEFGKEPYAAGENGGIQGHVIYASTRPFDDPMMLVQTQWEPLVPHVTINLYQEGFASDGVTPTRTLVDTTLTSSFDDWAQGFHLAADGVTKIPNMNCPGQSTQDLFYFTIQNQPNYLDAYNAAHGGPAVTPLPNNSQFKCYDGMHNWNQLQPAPYDGMYKFPSVTSTDPTTGKPSGTNCAICSPNHAVPTSDLYYGLPMLPAGKYVVEVVVPPGFELVKEEDKNILIGDNYIAPVIQEFGGLGNIFIIPDQASVAASQQYPGPGYNANNAQNPTVSLGTTPQEGIVPGFIPEPVWPCVGQARVVPDYISLFPGSKEVAPFAGATRNLCDRKEVTLGDQMAAIAKFYIFTSTHIASKFTGVITDDFTSEFDPFSPQFGEKFSPPNMPIAIRDWSSAEISRVYSDQWGAYNGMTYSTWEVNPPNPTGYSPTMMVFCMNDPGNAAAPDPLFNSQYSQFCYELPFMPGTTQYLDTPVVPTAAFVGAGYNNPDCAYPDATPAIGEVDGDTSTTVLGGGVGPWVSAPGHTLTIYTINGKSTPAGTTAGDLSVINYGYAGPSVSVAPFNAKTVTRHYGFGSTQGTGTVTIGGVTAPVTGWSDTRITVTVPAGVPACAIQQQAQYGGPNGTTVTTEHCGQLVVTSGNARQSVDTVTVTIGGKSPTRVASNTPLTQYGGAGSIQQAIDAARPGDLILIPPGQYQEMLLMWKPVRLQGVGALSSVINANTQPAGKLDPWRLQLNCLFGLQPNGTPINDGVTPSACGSRWGGFAGYSQNPQVDRLPLEGIVGWDTTTNGNLAQLLSEPTLMGAYEGAGITVVAKGVNPGGPGSVDGVVTGYYGSGAEAAFPTGTVVLTSKDCAIGPRGSNPYPSNFWCNPSRIDGLSITDSSQGGGGIFVHAWAHNLEIANNRVFNNIGTLSGGINIGQGESPDGYLAGTTADSDPGSCLADPSVTHPGLVNMQLPYCFDLNVNVHNNLVTSNTSIGDELFSGTPTGAGGVSFCTGADYYKFKYNWVCGNGSTGDGGGLAHVGYIWNGDIEHNTIIFNQSTNPSIATNGAGIVVMGAAPDGFTASGVECGSVVDVDCAPGLPDGTGPGLVINANLIMGNAAESGSGGGLRLQSVNGTEVSYFPNGARCISPGGLTECDEEGARPVWNTVTVTNNIIANNVAGWDGAGISLQDALSVKIINNTIVSNDTTSSSGMLFNTLGAPLASAPGATNQTTLPTSSAPQPAGVVSMVNSTNLTATFAGLTITCPPNFYAGSTASNGTCTKISYPYLANDVIWQNRSFYIGVGSLSSAYQQNIVSLYNASGTPAATQPSTDATTPNGNGRIITGGTGACTPGATYWDVGVRGDTGPGNHTSGYTLAATWSVMTNASEAGATTTTHNLLADPTFNQQYCNGSRVPPEICTGGATGCTPGWQVPPGISDATVPNPIFSLQPNATVDEGNNWVNISWGPLSMTNPSTSGVTAGVTLADYALASGSPAIDYISNSASTYGVAPGTDFFGNARKTDNHVDAGAVEFQGTSTASAYVSPTTLSFGNVLQSTTSGSQTLTLHASTATLTGITLAFSPTGPFTRATAAQGGAGSCGGTLAAGGTCTINVVFNSPATAGTVNVTLTITASGTILGSPVALSGTSVAPTHTAYVTPTALAFGNWATGTTSPVQTVTVTNTGNSALAGGGFTIPAPFSRVITGTFPSGAPNCAAALPVGASCTLKVQFTPIAATAYSLNLAVAYTGATVTGSPVALTGTGVAARATVSITPNPLTITLPSGTRTGTATVTLTNTAPAGTGAQTTVSSFAVSGGTSSTWFFNAANAAIPDTCTGTTLVPGESCTVGVRFTNATSPRGVNRAGTITFTNNGAGSPQSGSLIGHANP